MFFEIEVEKSAIGKNPPHINLAEFYAPDFTHMDFSHGFCAQFTRIFAQDFTHMDFTHIFEISIISWKNHSKNVSKS